MKRLLAILLVIFMAVPLCLFSLAGAETLRSNNFQIDESNVGDSGLLQSSSANYQLNDSIGDTAAGSSASSNFQIESGSKTTGDPALAFEVNDSAVNFPVFSPATAAVATSTFQVSNYTSYGYVVQILGTPPTSGPHTITAMSTAGASQAGTEQFGINLVANTSPTSVGANPDHGQFGFGSAAGNYNTANNYRYVSGDTIATAPKSSGVTLYTISYLVNVNSRTPGGNYISPQTLICTGTY
jgi:hypothetical protein